MPSKNEFVDAYKELQEGLSRTIEYGTKIIEDEINEKIKKSKNKYFDPLKQIELKKEIESKKEKEEREKQEREKEEREKQAKEKEKEEVEKNKTNTNVNNTKTSTEKQTTGSNAPIRQKIDNVKETKTFKPK
jgi:hypothetical protein